jgi:CheY-like chemotaxis protein
MTAENESSDRPSLLIVDDNEVNMRLLEINLEDTGLSIVKAMSGKEALEKAASSDFFMALLDVQMPVMDGFETARELRKIERLRLMPIIFVTALNRHPRWEQTGYQTGAVDFIYKPVDMDILKSKIRVFTELHEQKMTIQRQSLELQAKVRELETALGEIKTLKGILPICVHCKKIRNDTGYWEQVENYISSHSMADFSHGICPDCLRKHFPDLAEEILADAAAERASGRKDGQNNP